MPENSCLVHIEGRAPMLKSGCGGLHPDNRNKTPAKAYAPMVESSYTALQRKQNIGEFHCLEAYETTETKLGSRKIAPKSQ